MNKPTVVLIENDNVYGIIATVRKALIRSGQAEKATEFAARAKQCENYQAVLALCTEFVEVE